MQSIEKLAFSNPDVKPDDQLIFSKIGGKMKLWQAIMSFMSENYKESEGLWNYYNDGKQWLYKMVLKQKTVFWGTILDGEFRITFYFGGKAEPVIVGSDLPDNAKQQFLTGPRYGKIRAVTIPVSEIEDVRTVEKLVAIKVKMK